MSVKAHITHLKQPEDAYFKVVTVATETAHDYVLLDMVLAVCYAHVEAKHRKDVGNAIIEEFASLGAGVALCHHKDNFRRKLGRIIAKGRLLIIMRMY